jgi:polar amino acid transport system substrate-binding protein
MSLRKIGPGPLVLAFITLLLFMGCAVPDQRVTPAVEVEPDENVLRVGISANSPPLIYKQGQDIVGLEAELAKELAKHLGKSVRFIEVEWKDQIPALLENRTDIIMSGMSVTKLRQVRIAFTEPYFRTGQMGLIHKRDSNKFTRGYYSIQYRSRQIDIGVVRATTGETFVKKHLGKTKRIVSYESAGEAAKALTNRQIDVVIHDAPMIIMLAAEYETEGLVPIPSLLTEEYLAWGIRKDDVQLLEAANSMVRTMKADGRLHAIVNRWIAFSK